MDLNQIKKASVPRVAVETHTDPLWVSNLVLTPLWSQQNSFDSKFDDIFGSSSSSDPFNFNSQNGVNKDEK